jgi:hypothetical protein
MGRFQAALESKSIPDLNSSPVSMVSMVNTRRDRKQAHRGGRETRGVGDKGCRRQMRAETSALANAPG